MAVTTITTTGPEDARIVVAFGKYLGLGRNATQGEVAAAVRVWVRDIVVMQEAIAQRDALVPPTPIAPA